MKVANPQAKSMRDPQQIQLVNQLEHQANEAQLARNTAKDRLDIALYRSQQLNRYRWRQHGAAWLFAGLVGVGGTVYATNNEAPYIIPLAAGCGLGAGLLSNAADQRRQTYEKQDRLQLCRYDLTQSEKQLRQAVTRYREEEETGWLMYALDTSKDKLLALREWMADPRRTMKDAVLESIDIVTTQFLDQPLEKQFNDPLATERAYRQARQQLFSEAIALQKDEFLANVFTKHHLLREQELQSAGVKADWLTKGTTIGVGSAAGLLAGAGITALGSKAALGSSKAMLAHTITGTASIAAVVGVGLLTAGTVHRWINQANHRRRQQEAQQFQDAFAITTQILDNITQARGVEEPKTQHQSLQKALDCLNTLRRQAIKSQDRQMKKYVEILSDRLQQSLKATSQSTRFRVRQQFMN
jgi:hypothetical protein